MIPTGSEIRARTRLVPTLAPALGARLVSTTIEGAAAATLHAAVHLAVRAAAGIDAPRTADAWAVAAFAQVVAIAVDLLAFLVVRATRRGSPYVAIAILAVAWFVPALWVAASLTSGAWIATHGLRWVIFALAALGAPLGGWLVARGARAAADAVAPPCFLPVLPWLVAGVVLAHVDATWFRGTYPAVHWTSWVLSGYAWMQVARVLGRRVASRLPARILTKALATTTAGSALGIGLIDAITGSALDLSAPPPAVRDNGERVFAAELERLARGDVGRTLPPVRRAPPPTPRARHVVLVVVDTLRADYLETATATPGAAAQHGVPFLHELRGRSRRYEAAYTPVPNTRQAFPSLFHSVLRPPRDLDPARHLAVVLGGAGVRADAVVWDWFFLDRGLSPPSSISLRGFTPATPYTTAQQERAVPALLAQIRDGDPAARHFSWLHLACMHDPGFDGAPIARTASRTERYARSLVWLDGQMRRLVSALEEALARDLVLVVTADHGEGLGDHGNDYHGDAVWEEQVRVPLWVVGEGIAPTSDMELASLLDVPPTIADLLGVEPHPEWEGVSVFAPRAGRLLELRDIFDSMHAITDGRHKIVSWRNHRHLAYFDLDSDPTEQRPLDPMTSDVSRRLFRELVARHPAAYAPYLDRDGPRRALAAIDEATLDARSAELIRALRAARGRGVP